MRIRYGWELALAALLVIEIVAFGAINPRMLDPDESPNDFGKNH